MMVDFSYSADLVSKCDGLPVGALHWNELSFDHEVSIGVIKEACQNLDIIYNTTLREDWDIKIYPNPVKDIIHIGLQNTDSDFARSRFINMHGEVLHEADIVSGINEMNLSFLAKGIYGIQLYSEDHTLRFMHQIVRY